MAAAWNIKYLCRLGTAATKVATRANNNALRTQTQTRTHTSYIQKKNQFHLHVLRCFLFFCMKCAAPSSYYLFLLFLLLLFEAFAMAQLTSPLLSFDWGCQLKRSLNAESARRCLSLSLSISLLRCMRTCVCVAHAANLFVYFSHTVLVVVVAAAAPFAPAWGGEGATQLELPLQLMLFCTFGCSSCSLHLLLLHLMWFIQVTCVY